MHTDIIYGKASYRHIEGFLALQEQNLLAHVPEEAQAGGFVTTPFTTAQLEELIASEGITIASYNGNIIGYVVSASWQFLSIYPIFAYMVELLPDITYFAEPVTALNSYQYGPVCIDAAWRGKGILPQLFEAARQQMQPRYPYALTFVNSRNHRSRDAHIRKLGLAHLRDFAFNGQHYHMIGFLTT